MSKGSFFEFLLAHGATDDPEGDFVEDARMDGTFPVEASTWREIEDHLCTRFACPDAISAARRLWEAYEAAPPNRRTC